MTDVKAALERARASVRNAREILLSIPGHRGYVSAAQSTLETADALLNKAIDEEPKG